MTQIVKDAQLLQNKGSTIVRVHLKLQNSTYYER